MPPKINQARAHIAPEFVDVMISMYAEWAEKNADLIKRSLGNPRFQHFAQTARRMMPIVRRQSPNPREGLDYELTRLRGLPYTDFVVVEDIDPAVVPPYYDDEQPDWSSVPRIPWLCGRSKFVVMTNYAKRTEIMGQMGHYDVYIPSSIVCHPELGHIHMIPQRNQRAINRHPHHYIMPDNDVVNRSPLSYPTGNCYGDYSGVIKNLIDEPDFPELFRQLFGHLSTYGYAPPRRMSSLDFDHETPERP